MQARMMGLNNTEASNLSRLYDSRASHHITNELNILSLHSPYDSTDEIIIGDALSLIFTHVGSIKLYFYNVLLILHNVLSAPFISRNIIFSHLCLDNHILI